MDAAWFRYETLQQTYATWQHTYRQQQENKQKRTELTVLKQKLEPEFRMQLEDVEELYTLHQQKQQLTSQISEKKKYSVFSYKPAGQVRPKKCSLLVALTQK